MNPSYRVVLAESAYKEFQRLPAVVRAKAAVVIDALAVTPRPPNRCTKLKYSTNRWRIRVGEYRIVYQIDDQARVVDVVRIRHRKDAYRL